MALALVTNSFLDKGSSDIRKKPVPWDGYQRAGLITSDELALIKKVDKQPKQKVESLLVTEGQAYATLYLRLLGKLVRIDTLQFILVMIADALTGAFVS